MARLNNAITLGHGFNVTAESPIDSRTLVDRVQDLINPNTWGDNVAPLYNGLIVSVLENNAVYMLIDKENFTDIEAGWKRLGDGGGSQILITGDDVEE